MNAYRSLVFCVGLGFACGSWSLAATSTWNGPGSDFNSAANWTAGIPSDIGGFNAASPLSISLSTETTLNGLTFNVGSASYTITVPFLKTLNMNGSGITNNSTNRQTLDVDGGIIFFNNNSKAANSIIRTSPQGSVVFSDAASAENAALVNGYSGYIAFNNSSTASSATFTNSNGGLISFFDTSTSANGTFSNNGDLSFSDSSSAHTATIYNNAGGRLSFLDAATASSATITNNADSNTSFNMNSTAADAHITNNGGSTEFNQTTTAANATISNADGGNTTFFMSSTGGNSFITNNSAGGTTFYGSLGPDSARIVNNSGGVTSFLGSTGGNASITNNGGGSTIFDTSSGGRATITNDGGTTTFNGSSADYAAIVNNNGGITNFVGGSDGGQAVITNNAGGTLKFYDVSTVNHATVINNSGGLVDISGVTSNFSMGSLAGAGSYFLGSKTLSVGSNGLNTTVSGVISGIGGALVKVGTGTLTLSGANSYTGGTIVSGGVLKTGASNVLPHVGMVTLADQAGTALDLNGSNQTIGSLSGGGSSGGNTNLGAGSLTTGADNHSTTYDGIISGNGSLIKVGTGTFTLSGNHAYSGNTSISAGELNLTGSLQSNVSVGSDGILTGTGSMKSLTNNGTITVGVNGGGALTAASYSGSGTLNIAFNGASNASLNVVGDANLTGGKLNLTGSNFRAGEYTVLTAGSITGTFSDVTTTLSPFFTYITQYSSTDLEIIIKEVAFRSAALSGNQQSVTAALDLVKAGATGGSAEVVNALLAISTSEQAQDAFNQISGDALASMQGVGLHGAGVFTSQMNDRAAPRSAFTTARLMAPVQLAYAGDARDLDLSTTTAPASGLWARGLGFFDSTEADAAIGSPASRATSGGFQWGYDIPIDDQALWGFSGGYAKSSLSIDDRSSSGEATTYQAGVYGRYTPGPWFFHGSLAYSTSANEMSRTISFPGVYDVADSHFGTQVMTTSAEGGYSFKPRKAISIDPSVSLRYSRLKQDGFLETGAPGLNLDVAEQTLNSVVSAMGVRLSRHFQQNTDRSAAVAVRTAWQHEYADINNSITAQFAEATGTPFTVQGTPRDRDAVTLGLDGHVNLSQRWMAFADYSATLSSNQQTQVVMGGLKWRW